MLNLKFFFVNLGCTSALQSKKCIFCFAGLSVCTNFALAKDETKVNEGCYVSASLACTTGKKHFEAADKCVRSLIFCVRTSGKPYTLNDADFFVLHNGSSLVHGVSPVAVLGKEAGCVKTTLPARQLGVMNLIETNNIINNNIKEL